MLWLLIVYDQAYFLSCQNSRKQGTLGSLYLVCTPVKATNIPQVKIAIFNCFSMSLSIRNFLILKGLETIIADFGGSIQEWTKLSKRYKLKTWDRACLVHTPEPGERRIVLFWAAQDAESCFQISLEDCLWKITNAHADEIWIILMYRLCDGVPPQVCNNSYVNRIRWHLPGIYTSQHHSRSF